MSTENSKEIVDFEGLFETKVNDTPVKPAFPLNRAILSVVLYFIIMLVVAGVAVAIFYTDSRYTKDYSTKESMLFNLSQNPNGIGYLEVSHFDAYQSDYPNLIVIYESQDYVIIANDTNPYLKDEYTLEMIQSFYLIENIRWNNVRPSVYVDLYLFEDYQPYLTQIGVDALVNADRVKTPKAFTELTDNASSLLNFAIYIVLAIGVIPITFGALKAEASYFKQPLKKVGVETVIGYGIMLLASIGAQFVTQAIGYVFDYAQPVSLNQQAIERSLLSSTGVLMIIVTVLFAPVIEELIFRKAMFRFFKNQWAAMIISSLIFGLIHVASETNFMAFFTNLITYSASGFALGYIYIRNKHNVWSVILVHALSNAVSIVAILLLALL
jgi:membrane protease YdiL (CAAX protease family)